MRLTILLPLLASTWALPAVAQEAASPAPTATTSPADPVALPEARRVVARLLPPGIYKKMMSATMSTVTSTMGDSLKAMPLRQIAELGGLDAKRAAALDKVDVAQIMAIYDPHWQQRMQLSMQAMFEAMGDFFTTLEPDLREAMAHAYVNHFSPDELRDLDRYFSTPTGAKYAAQSMTMMADPAMMAGMKSMMPKMMKQMPTFIAAAQKATASLPPPRKVEDLTPAEKAQIAKMLGVDPAKLHNPKSAT